jgi:hypothetical protein
MPGQPLHPFRRHFAGHLHNYQQTMAVPLIANVSMAMAFGRKVGDHISHHLGFKAGISELAYRVQAAAEVGNRNHSLHLLGKFDSVVIMQDPYPLRPRLLKPGRRYRRYIKLEIFSDSYVNSINCGDEIHFEASGRTKKIIIFQESLFLNDKAATP